MPDRAAFSRVVSFASVFLLAFCAAVPEARSQGAMEPPPGPPGPTQKSLQEIWDSLEAARSNMDVILRERDRISAQIARARLQNALLLNALGASIFQPERTTLFLNEFAHIDVEVPEDAGYEAADLEYRVVPPEGAWVSRSMTAVEAAEQPRVTLLAGATPGDYVLEAVDPNTGAVVSSLDFAVTDEVVPLETGPSQWILGAHTRLGASGAAWGGGGGNEPENYRVYPVSGDYKVAIILFDTPQARYTQAEVAATMAEYSAAMDDDVIPWFDEVSGGRVQVSYEIGGAFNVASSWDSLFKVRQGNAYTYENGLFQTVVTAVGDQMNLQDADSLLLVSRSRTNRGVDTDGNPLPDLFAWPVARPSRAYLLNLPPPGGGAAPVPASVNAGGISMPHDWVAQQNRPLAPVIIHETLHNLGLGDIYAWEGHAEFYKARAPGGWAMMANEQNFPHVLLAHKLMLGWLEKEDIKLYNFEVNGDVAINELVSLSALSGGNNDPDVYAGIEVRRADGWSYYFEYRQLQPGGESDRSLPADSRVVGTDVAFGPEFDRATRRKPIMLLASEYGDGPVLDVGQSYREIDFTDPADKFEFELAVTNAGANSAQVQVLYGANMDPGPPAGPYTRPDPSIRPWSRANWQSPDILVKNERSEADPEWTNVPWSNQLNTIEATIRNRRPIAAPGVQAIFRVRDYNVSGAPAQDIGIDTQDIPANGSATFTSQWRPSQGGHYCIEVEIVPYTHPVSGREELDETNNKAQSNYTRFNSAAASPAERFELEFTVSNPYEMETIAEIFVEQTNPLYLTLLETTSVTLAPLESRKIRAWFEYFYADKPLPEGASSFLLAPNDVNLHASIFEPEEDHLHASEILGGGLIRVVTGQATEFTGVVATGSGVSGRVVTKSNGAGVTGGKVILGYQAQETNPLSLVYQTEEVDGDGYFSFSGAQPWEEATLTFVAPAGYGDAEIQLSLP